MATIQDVLAFNSYRGDANLGGGGLGVIKFDPAPLENLARYTMMYNKAEYDQRAKDTQEKIGELAELTALDPNSAIPKDREYLMGKYTEAMKYGEEYARKMPKNNEERVRHYMDYKQKMQGLKKEITAGTARSVAYVKRKQEIANDPKLNGAQKALAYQELDDEANATDIFTPINPQEKFELTIPEVPAGVQRKTATLQDTGNKVVSQNFTIFDPQATMNLAYMTSAGLSDRVIIAKGTPEYNNLSASEKRENDRLALVQKSGPQIWNKAAEALNTALKNPAYRTENGAIDMEAVRSSNKMVGDVLDLVDRWNQYASQKKTEAARGVYTDSMGRGVKLQNAIEAKDYFTIDPNKPITPQQIVFLQSFAKSAPDGVEKDFKQTNEALARDDNARGWAAHNENVRHNKAAEAKAAAAGSGSPVATGEFGNIIDGVNVDELYTPTTDGKRKRMVDEKGNPLRLVNGTVVNAEGTPVPTGTGTFVVPASAIGDAIITEFNKAAGTTAKAGTNDPENTPVSKIKANDKGMITIRIANGQIDGVLTENGSFADRNQFEDITQKAALKGVTKQKPATDLGEINRQQAAGRSSGSSQPATVDKYAKYKE